MCSTCVSRNGISVIEIRNATCSNTDKIPIGMMINPDGNNKVPDENHLMINTYLTDFFMTVIPVKLTGTSNSNNTITDISHHRIAV